MMEEAREIIKLCQDQVLMVLVGRWEAGGFQSRSYPWRTRAHLLPTSLLPLP